MIFSVFASNTGAWGNTNDYVGALFLNYSNNDIIQTTFAILGSIWTVIPLVMIADMVYTPIFLAQEMDKAFNAGTADKEKQDIMMLTNSFIIALGSFIGASSMGNGIIKLTSYFDLINSTAINAYKAKFISGSDDEKKVAASAIEMDVFHHSITTGFYYLVGSAIANGAYYYSLNSIQKFAVANQ